MSLEEFKENPTLNSGSSVGRDGSGIKSLEHSKSGGGGSKIKSVKTNEHSSQYIHLILSIHKLGLKIKPIN